MLDVPPSFGAPYPEVPREGFPDRCFRLDRISDRLHLDSAAWLVVPWALVLAGVISLVLTQRRIWRRIALGVAVSCSVIGLGVGYAGWQESDCLARDSKLSSDRSAAASRHAEAEEAIAIRECAFGDGGKHAAACVVWLRGQAADADAETKQLILRKINSLCAKIPRGDTYRERARARALCPCNCLPEDRLCSCL